MNQIFGDNDRKISVVMIMIIISEHNSLMLMEILYA